MKRLIYQVYTGNRSKLYDWCVNSVQDYSKEYGIDHIIQQIPKMRIKPDVFATNRSKESYEKYGGFLPIYEKENAFDYWDRYDQICIIDADIYIRPGAPNIFNELKDDTDFAGVLEREMPIQDWYVKKLVNYTRMQYSQLQSNKIDWDFGHKHGARFYNMGMMLMNKSISKYLNGDSGKEFIQRPEFKDFVDGQGAWKWSTDQTLLNYWIRKENMKQQPLDWKYNTLFTAVADDKLKEGHFIHFFLKDKLPRRGENVEELKRLI